MKKFVALLMKEKRPGMNGKMMALTFFELYTVYIKKLGQFFLYFTIHYSVASYKYFKKLNKWSMETLALGVLKILCIHLIPLIKL